MTCVGNVCGTGGWKGPKPGDPSNDINIQAVPAFGGIDVLWSFPSTNPFALAYGIIFRGLTADFNGAIPVGKDTDGFFHDRVDPGTVYYYWVQVVSINGTFGEVIGPASASAKATIEQTMRDLTGMIDMSVLGLALRSEIERIPLISDSILQEIQDRLASNVALQTALSAVRSEVDEALTYMLQETTARTTADTAMVNQLNVIASGVGDAVAAIAEERMVRAGKDDALAQSILTLAAETEDGSAAIIEEREARISADGALASSVSTLATKTGTDIATAIQTEAQARTTAIDAYATTVSTLYAKKDALSAAIQSEQQARANADGALSERIDTIQTSVGEGTAAAIQEERQARIDADGALAQQVLTMETELDGNLVQAEQRMDTKITTVNDKVTEIGSLWYVKMNVNGLASGFGMYNNGTTAVAGWDVDTFFVGRTNANKIKPFIIDGDTVHIDEAAINKLTFTKLRDESGAVMVENGKLKADYINTSGIVVTGTNGGGLNIKPTTPDRVEITNKGMAIYVGGVLRGFFGDDS